LSAAVQVPTLITRSELQVSHTSVTKYCSSRRSSAAEGVKQPAALLQWMKR